MLPSPEAVALAQHKQKEEKLTSWRTVGFDLPALGNIQNTKDLSKSLKKRNRIPHIEVYNFL